VPRAASPSRRTTRARAAGQQLGFRQPFLAARQFRPRRVAAQIGQVLGHGGRGQVAKEDRVRAVENGPDAGVRLADVFGAIPLGQQVPAVILDVLGQRPGMVGLERVRHAGRCHLGLADLSPQHQLGGLPVAAEGHGPRGAGNAAVPLGGLLLDLAGTGRALGHLPAVGVEVAGDVLSEDVCHRKFPCETRPAPPAPVSLGIGAAHGQRFG
jgi:hypothetical protein